NALELDGFLAARDPRLAATEDVRPPGFDEAHDLAGAIGLGRAPRDHERRHLRDRRRRAPRGGLLARERRLIEVPALHFGERWSRALPDPSTSAAPRSSRRDR